MGGGLMQLVAYGAQDIYLTGNPQITFFKVVYRRHTNFSMEAIQQTFTGEADFGKSATATISRNGDLVYRMYIEHQVTVATSKSSKIVNNYGNALLKKVDLEIGGQLIDRQYGRWMQIYSDLTEFNPSGTVGSCSDVPGANSTLYQRMSGTGHGYDHTATTWTGTHFTPLQFWFCRNPGLALPLIALQYHEVKLKIDFEDNALLINGTTPKLTANLWVDYIYLDTDERRRFAQVSHEYLIEQVQYETETVTGASNLFTVDKKLNFNHPVKELIWQFSESTTQLTNDVKSTLATGLAIQQGEWQLKLNGHDRFAARSYKYFTETQVWEHHTGYGGTISKDSIAVYSFALKPEEHQPSGTCNFSRIDNANLKSTAPVRFTNGTLNGPAGPEDIHTSGSTYHCTCHIYAINYNVLRIMSGMGGLAYSN